MASNYGIEYRQKATELFSEFFVNLPGLPPELKDKTSPQFDAALEFALGRVYSTNLDVEPERVALKADGILEKLLLHGHYASATKMKNALNILQDDDGSINQHYRAISLLLELAQAPTGSGAHFHAKELKRIQAEEEEINAMLQNNDFDDDHFNANADDISPSIALTSTEQDDLALKTLISQSLDEWNGTFDDDDSEEGGWGDSDDDDDVGGDADGDKSAITEEVVNDNLESYEGVDLPKHDAEKTVGIDTIEIDDEADEEEQDDEEDEDDHSIVTVTGREESEMKQNESGSLKRRLLARSFGQEVGIALKDKIQFQVPQQSNIFSDQKQSSQEVIVNGLRSVLMSESEAIRSCIHALMGFKSPLFYFKSDLESFSTVEVNDDDDTILHQTEAWWGVGLSTWLGSGNSSHGFCFDHLSNKALSQCLVRFADHASDLRFLRLGILEGTSEHVSSGVWGAWKSVVAEWLNISDKQLVTLEQVAYKLLAHHNTCSLNEDKNNVTGTLVRLQVLLDPAARRSRQLRHLCYKLAPWTASLPCKPTSVSTTQSPIERLSMDRILSNVLAACQIVNGIWSELQIAELYQINAFDDVSSPPTAPAPPNPSLLSVSEAPPCVKTAEWLRNTLCVVLGPMLETWSTWVLEGRLEDPCKESFLSLHASLSNQEPSSSLHSPGGSSPDKISSPLDKTTNERKDNNAATRIPLPPIENQVPILFSPCASLILSSGHAVKLMRSSMNKRGEYTPNTLLRINRHRGLNIAHGFNNDRKSRNNKRTKEVHLGDDDDEEDDTTNPDDGSSFSSESDGAEHWTESMQWIETSLLRKLQEHCRLRDGVFSLVHLFRSSCHLSVHDDEEDDDDDVDDDSDDDDDDESDEDEEEEDDEESGWGGGWEEDRASFKACERFQDLKHFTEREVASPFISSLYRQTDESIDFGHKAPLGRVDKETGGRELTERRDTADMLHHNFILPLVRHCSLANKFSAQELLRTGGVGHDLISALQVLRSIYLGSDGLLLSKWRESLFEFQSTSSLVNELPSHDHDQHRYSHQRTTQPTQPVSSNTLPPPPPPFTPTKRSSLPASSMAPSQIKVTPWMGLKDPLNLDTSSLSEIFRSSVLDAAAVSRADAPTSLAATTNSYQTQTKANQHPKHKHHNERNIHHQLVGCLPLWFIEGGGVLSLDDFRIELLPSAAASMRARKRDVHLRSHLSLSQFYSSSSSTATSTPTSTISPMMKNHIQNHVKGKDDPLLTSEGVTAVGGALLLPAPLFLPTIFQNTKLLTKASTPGKIYNTPTGQQQHRLLTPNASIGGGGVGGDLAWADGVRQLGWLKLSCTVGEPFNAVVSPMALNGYNKIWVFLQQVRYAHSAVVKLRWSLNKTRKFTGLKLTQNLIHERNEKNSFQNGKQGDDEVIIDWHKVVVQLGLVAHVVSSLQNYLMNHTSMAHWPHLVTSLEKSQSIDELRQCHDKYLLKILKCCMLTPRASKVHEYLLRVMSDALRYASFGSSLFAITQEIRKLNNLIQQEEEEKETRGDGNNEGAVILQLKVQLNKLETFQMIVFRQLEECYENFLQDIKYVTAVAQRLVVTRHAPYLADVLLILDYNQFFEDNLNSL